MSIYMHVHVCICQCVYGETDGRRKDRPINCTTLRQTDGWTARQTDNGLMHEFQCASIYIKCKYTHYLH